MDCLSFNPKMWMLSYCRCRSGVSPELGKSTNRSCQIWESKLSAICEIWRAQCSKSNSAATVNPVKLSWEDFSRLPRVAITSDFHCVTRWSRFDNHWEGVAFREIMKLAVPEQATKYLLAHAEQGYTANIPLADLDRDNVLLATHHDGRPLEPEHGYPLRLIVPHLYAWKSVKWVRGFEFLESDEPGFWEQNGYHMHGDPWQEQRYDTD